MAGRRLEAQVLHVSVVVAIGIHHAATYAESKVLQHLVTHTELATVVILTTLGAHVKLVTLQHVRLSLNGGHHLRRNQLFEHANTVVKLTLAAATRDAEVERGKPLVAYASKVERGNDGSRSLTLIFLPSVSAIRLAIHRAIRIEGELALGRTRLVSALNVEAQVPAVAHETNTCGVAVSTVDSHNSVARRVTQEGNALVRVSKEATGLCQRGCAPKEGCGKERFSHFSSLLVNLAAKVGLPCTCTK